MNVFGRKRRKLPRGIFIDRGTIPGFGYRTGNTYADQLRAAGIVQDREKPGLAAHKRRMRARFVPGWAADAMAAVGIGAHDQAAAHVELDGYTWAGRAAADARPEIRWAGCSRTTPRGNCAATWETDSD